MREFFYPKSIAVIGATPKKGKVGYSLIENLKQFRGKVYPINPNHTNVLGLKCYPSIKDVKDDIDLAVIAVPNVIVPKVLKECGEKGVRAVVIISAGFKEVGNIELENEVYEISKRYDMRIIGPNCLGMMNTENNLNATFGKIFPDKGHIAVISQSGAILDSILDVSKELGIGMSKVVSVGNKVDIQESEILKYLIEDKETKIIAMYIEGLKDRRFFDVAKEVSKKKPIIVLKSGRTKKGKRVASSHTGSLAGEDEIYNALFEQTGIIRVDRFDQLINLMFLFSTQPLLRSNRIGILTNAGGFGVISADACEKSNLDLPKFEKRTVKKLKSFLPSSSNFDNPLDIIGDADPERYKKSIDSLIEDKNIDGLLIILTPQEMTEPMEVAKEIVNINSNKTIVTSFVGGKSVTKAVKYLLEHNIPSFESPEKAIEYLSCMVEYSRRGKFVEKSKSLKNLVLQMKEQNKKIIENLLKEKNEFNAKKVLNIYGIPTPTGYLVKSSTEMLNITKKMKRFVMKISSPQIRHKTDAGCVVLNPKDPERAFKIIMKNAKEYIRKHKIKNAKIDGILIEEMVNPGTEIIVGAKRDPIFGPVVMVGAGGIFVEILKDVSFGIMPITESYAEAMVKKLKIYNILRGVRGEKKKDIEFIKNLIQIVGTIMELHPEIKEIDLNPVIVYEHGGIVVDAVIV